MQASANRSTKPNLFGWMSWVLVLGTLLPSSLCAQVGFPVGSGATADKPQSKCWYHDGSWWSVLFDGAEGSFFYRFADGMWRRQTFPDALIYPALPTRADVLSQGDTLFVLEWEAVAPRLYKYIYQSNLRRYHLIPGFPVRLNLPTGHETLVIARDSNGVSWLTFEHAGKVKAVCSNANDYLVWDVDGVKIAEGLKDDDIGSIIAFKGQIGVFWSNQNTQSLHFRVHRDGAPKETWERAELVARGGYVADDHINLARGTDGRIYAVTKTSVDDVEGPVNGPTQAQIVLNVRSPEGNWQLYDVAPVSKTFTTRPIVILDEENGEIYVFYRHGDAIVHKKTSMKNINFEADVIPVIAAPGVVMNNVTSTKQNVSSKTGLMVLATGNDNRVYHQLLRIHSKSK